MRTGMHIRKQTARSAAARTLQALAVVAGIGFAPLAASSAAPAQSDFQASTGMDAAAAAAFVELLPVQPGSATIKSESAAIVPAEISAPQESVIGRGSASYYADKFNGRRTASGERFDNDEMTAAHRTLPFGSRVRVTNPGNGRSVVVRINDRGPFTRGRMIDVSRAAAQELGLIARGHGNVELALLGD